MYATALVCANCAHAYPLDARYACDRCFGPLEPEYDLDAVRRVVTRERIAAGPHTLWRYADLLPTTAAPARCRSA
jgi:threonine synthase